MTVYTVTRHHAGKLIKTYGPFIGPFAEAIAEHVAQAASEKHRGDVVMVVPEEDEDHD